MNWRSWSGHLFPTEEKKEPLFRQELERLALTGVRLVAWMCLIGPPLFVLLGVAWLPDLVTTMGLRDPLAIFLLGALTLWISYWPRLQSRSRLIGLAAIYGMVVFDWLGFMRISVTDLGRGAFTAGSFALAMLLVIASLPVKPLQTLVLGLLLIATYVGGVLTTGLLPAEGSSVSIAAIAILFTLPMSVALTVVVYQQRLSAYNARRAAEEAFELLRLAQVRVCVSENDASQGRFAAAMSHELNSPLGALTSAFDTLIQVHERERSQPEQLEKLKEVFEQAARSGRQSTERLKETVGRMKRLTNLDRAEERVVDLNELWRDTVALLEPELTPKAEVKLDLTPIPPLKCRPQALGAVFSNLLRNAAAAMDRRGRIQVSSHARNGEIILEVQDNGRGIPAEQMEELFDPAFRVEQGRVATTHWGLFITRTIVTEHGGHIEFDSKEGQGTTARILLPVAANPQSECAGCSAA
jgi:signal transduction histidine kinase